MLWLLFALFTPSQAPTFKEQTIDSNISIGYGIAIGDVDGDKKKDILLADKKQIVWYRNGDWRKFVMAENLTEFDNVCIAARDLDNDGRVEVAVGAQWNPGETSDKQKSGSVHFLKSNEDPTQAWLHVSMYHEPTIHRMRWMRNNDGSIYLLVLPLHGVGNKDGQGTGVNLLAYKYPGASSGEWKLKPIGLEMHLTHNFDIIESAQHPSQIIIAGKEGLRVLPASSLAGNTSNPQFHSQYPAGEVRVGLSENSRVVATIEPMHGNSVVLYEGNSLKRVVLDTTLREGHAVAAADFAKLGYDQVIAGWRVPDKDGNTGIRIYYRKNRGSQEWITEWIDKNGIACEDIQIDDLNNDGKPDIIASGRASKNVKIYWNNRP